jgi:hypothetical protein
MCLSILLCHESIDLAIVDKVLTLNQILFYRLASSAMALVLLLSLFASPVSASPIPNDDNQQAVLDLGFKHAPSPKEDPVKGLPVKLYVHAGPTCHSERTHLYYLPENVCIGPLYHPAGSFKLMSSLPEGCYIKGFAGGHCRGDEVRVNHEDRFAGPHPKGMCVNMETGFKHGANDCGRYGQ